MSIYTLHLQKIEHGKPAFEVTVTVMVDDEQQACTADTPDSADRVAQCDDMRNSHAPFDPPHCDDIVVSDAAVSYSVTIQRDRTRNPAQSGEGHITFSNGSALARSL